jgi:type III secretion protein R
MNTGVAAVLALAAPGSAGATPLTSRPLVLMLAMAALSLLPFVLLLMTSFVKIAVVLSILKGALGTPQIPPTQVVTGLALILTCYVMAPTGERMYRAIEPLLGRAAGADLISAQSVDALTAAGDRAKEPLREFLLRHGSPRDRALFHNLALRLRTPAERAQISDRDLLVAVPAFLTSELRRAFEIGFLLFLPFLVVDMVIANLLLALGMHMLSPTTVSLPFKLLLFVLADGWQLLLRGLVESYV